MRAIVACAVLVVVMSSGCSGCVGGVQELPPGPADTGLPGDAATSTRDAETTLDGGHAVDADRCAAACEVTWRNLSDRPNPVGFGTAIFDPVLERVLHFSWMSNEVWELRTTTANPRWRRLSIGGVDPPVLGTLVYDSRRRRMLVVQMNWSLPAPRVWSLPLDAEPTWSELVPQGKPPSERDSVEVVYDETHDRLLIYGGRIYDPNGPQSLNEVWSLSLADGMEWRELRIENPPPLSLITAAAFDAVRQRLLVFVGYTSFASAEMWALEVGLGQTPSWVQLATNVPWDGSSHLLVDQERDRVLVVGVRTPRIVVVPIGEESSWFELDTSRGGPFHPISEVVLDSERDRLITYGDRNGTFGTVRSDIWSLHLERLDWSVIENGPLFPPATFGAEQHVFYDEQEDLIWSITSPRDGTGLEVWNRTLEQDAAWERVVVTSSVPAGRTIGAAAWDPGGRRSMIYGGYEQLPPPDHLGDWLTDTWFFSSESERWSPLETAGSSPTDSGDGFYDPQGRRMLIASGYGSNFRLDALNLDDATPSWQGLKAGAAPDPERRALAYDPVHDRILGIFSDLREIQLWSFALSAGVWTESTLEPLTVVGDFMKTLIDPIRRQLLIFDNGATCESGLLAISLDQEPTSWRALVTRPGSDRTRLYHFDVEALWSPRGIIVLPGFAAPSPWLLEIPPECD